MRYLNLFILFFCLIVPTARANEAMLQSMQNQMSSLQGLIKSLESTVQDLRVTVESQNEVIQKQSIRINALEGKKSSAQTAQDSAIKVAGLSQGFNPDIGVVGTVQAHLTEDGEDAEGKDAIALKELELSFAQYVDPYSRLDAVIAFNDNLEAQNVDIEEAYYTHWGLPFGFVGRIGKFRTQAGKQNLQHLHQLDTVNYALVIRNFFGEEGMASSGLRLQNFIPNPFDIPIEITGEVLRGNNGDSFGGVSRHPIFNTHIKSFFELSDDATLELGGTWMNGDENVEGSAKGDDRFGVHIFGGDATLLVHLPNNRQLKWQNEVYYQTRSSVNTANKNPWGFYSLVDFRLSPKFSAGIRFDYLQPREVQGEHSESYEISPYITFWQSEFSNFRLQYSHVQPAANADESDDAVFLQANFLIGAHSHPVT